ncbi:MAG: Bax inhibitor-1 family protein [Alphaproteobacteria bacterium]
MAKAKKATLQHFMRDTYYTMALGLTVSAMLAFGVENIYFLGNLFLGFPLIFLSIMAPLVFIWLGFSRQRIERMEAQKITISYFAYAAMMGVSLTALFGIFVRGMMGPMLFITAIAYAAAALFGQLTRRDIGKLDSFLVMAATGGVLVMALVSRMGLDVIQIIACALVLVAFIGIAAWEEHILHETYDHGLDMNDPLRLSVTGAFIMYMGFMGLFEMLWGFTGSAKKRR